MRNSLLTTIDLELGIDSDCGTVMADPTQGHQIEMNLCTNAYHALEFCRGRLCISLCEEELE